MASVLAHQGGWDEALLVAIPMVLVSWLLWLAKRRVNRAELRSGHVNRPNSVVSGDQNELDALDAGADRGEAADEVVVASVDVPDAADRGDALGGEAGDHHGGPGPDVVGPDRRP
jgi:hypothetical protein